jgi:hypothetical protein
MSSRRFETLEKESLRDLLVRNWMTHDAMWFAHAAQHCGMEKANLLNRTAVRAMAAVEVRRLQKALGFAEITSFEELREFVLQAFELLRAPFMQFRLSFPERNRMRWEIESCFAYQGVKKLGVADHYECGIFERLESWFDTLGVAWSATPPVEGCLFHRTGACAREYRFALPEQRA